MKFVKKYASGLLDKNPVAVIEINTLEAIISIIQKEKNPIIVNTYTAPKDGESGSPSYEIIVYDDYLE